MAWPILVEAATDNRNRTAAEVRSIFTKAGGQLAGSGAVAWQFEPRGLITVVARRRRSRRGRAGRDRRRAPTDVDTEVDPIEIYTDPGDLEIVRKSLEAAGVGVEAAESTMLAKQTVSLDADHVRKTLRLVELLEDLDDVQRVTANVDIPDELLAEVAG